MDILAKDRQKQYEVLQSEKYLRVKERASQLAGANIELSLTEPENITVNGNYNAKIWDFTQENYYIKDVKIKVPYKAKTFDLSEDSLLAFVLSEYFYAYKGEKFFLADKRAAELTGNPAVLIETLSVFKTIFLVSDDMDSGLARRGIQGEMWHNDYSTPKNEKKNGFVEYRINKLKTAFGISLSETQSEIIPAHISEKSSASILPQREPKAEKPPLKEIDGYFVPPGVSDISENSGVFTNPDISPAEPPPFFLFVLLVIIAAALIFLGVKYGFKEILDKIISLF